MKETECCCGPQIGNCNGEKRSINKLNMHCIHQTSQTSRNNWLEINSHQILKSSKLDIFRRFIFEGLKDFEKRCAAERGKINTIFPK